MTTRPYPHKKDSLKRRVMEKLLPGPLTASELATATGQPRAAVLKAVNRAAQGFAVMAAGKTVPRADTGRGECLYALTGSGLRDLERQRS